MVSTICSHLHLSAFAVCNACEIHPGISCFSFLPSFLPSFLFLHTYHTQSRRCIVQEDVTFSLLGDPLSQAEGHRHLMPPGAVPGPLGMRSCCPSGCGLCSPEQRPEPASPPPSPAQFPACCAMLEGFAGPPPPYPRGGLQLSADPRGQVCVPGSVQCIDFPFPSREPPTPASHSALSPAGTGLPLDLRRRQFRCVTPGG